MPKRLRQKLLRRKMPQDKEKPVVKPKEKTAVTKKPERGDFPTGFDGVMKWKAALDVWRKLRDKALGHEEIMKFDATKTTDAAEKEMEKAKSTKAIQKGTEAIMKEVGMVKQKPGKKLTRAEQLAELKRIRKRNKRLRDKKAQEEAKKKKN